LWFTIKVSFEEDIRRPLPPGAPVNYRQADDCSTDFQSFTAQVDDHLWPVGKIYRDVINMLIVSRLIGLLSAGPLTRS
jgi:hypothetical protein